MYTPLIGAAYPRIDRGNSPSSYNRTPRVSDTTVSFMLPSGSTTGDRRQEDLRPNAPLPLHPRPPPGAHRLQVSRTMTPVQTLQRHAPSRRDKHRARALALYAGASRSPSPVRRGNSSTDPSSSKSRASKMPSIKSIRNTLKMTKIRNAPNSLSKTSSLADTQSATSQANLQARQRAKSEPVPRRGTETVILTKHVVP